MRPRFSSNVTIPVDVKISHVGTLIPPRAGVANSPVFAAFMKKAEEKAAIKIVLRAVNEWEYGLADEVG